MRKKDLLKKVKFKKQLRNNFKKAVFHYEMIKNGDRILVGFSGGKDSNSLILLFKYFQLTSGIKFDFEVITIHYGMKGENYEKQIKDIQKFDIKTHLFKTNIFDLAQTLREENSSFCSFVSRMRRGKLTEYAKKFNFNKIALGHHLDDAAESLMMGIIHNGVIRSLPPIYKNQHNQIILRPLIFEREKDLAKFCRINNFTPVGDEMCPGMCVGNMPRTRQKMKKLLSGIEKENSKLFNSLRTALQNINEEALLDKKKLKIFNKNN